MNAITQPANFCLLPSCTSALKQIEVRIKTARCQIDRRKDQKRNDPIIFHHLVVSCFTMAGVSVGVTR